MQTKKPWRLGTRAQLLLRGLRYAPILPYASIDGWLTVDEAIALYELARSLPQDRAVAVEIGCWQGKSSVCIARGLAGKNAPRLCCIDPFDASGDRQSEGEYAGRAGTLAGPLRSAFEANLEAAGVRNIVEVVQGLSYEHAAAWQGAIDLLFLDGDHSFDAVCRDFTDWAPKVRPGGFVALHDVVHAVHDGPRRVVDEILRADAQWVEGRYVDSMFVARKARA
ncbi:MAG TPA: class I SAM-dependent methyltransferase [Planctomycetota bacterium]|nr:class I SAM-dependent methyltransferase [Planctomycetota bacterium]